MAYIKNQAITDFAFREITPDADANWLNQSTSDFDSCYCRWPTERPSLPSLSLMSGRSFAYILDGHITNRSR